jgi:acyl-CoA synthetase (AMP-forming)/AMP-acid ligase II
VAPGSGVIGRIARTGNVPLGYYKDPERSAQTFIEHEGRRYAIAGDFARVEADGQITLLGRGSIVINTGGEKVFPEEVEGVLKAHPDVFDALVVGVPDDRWGERVTAVVAPRPGAAPTLEALAEHCRARLAAYKAPKQLVLVPEIVRAPSGKPDYPWAKRTAAEAAAVAG